jgi:hypothetical protein
MEYYRDFKELLVLFNAHGVDYAIVGAYALGHYGAPRYTADMDLLVRHGEENVKRVVAALNEFGFESLGFTPQDFSNPDQVLQLGVPPVRIDILTSLTGVSWEEVAAGRVAGTFGEVNVFYIGKDEFILNKRATGRKKDAADLEAIGEE